MASQIKKEAECPICLEMLKKPIRTLNCGHNFCHDCLHDVITSTKESRCPICRCEIDSSKSAEKFPRNRLVENMIENMNKLSVAPTVKVVQEVKVLTGDAVKQLTDLAKSYEQTEQFNEAVNTWRTIIGHCQHINKILPLVSMIGCLLKIGELDEAEVPSVVLISLLESTADQMHPMIDKYDDGIHNLVTKFVEFKKFNVIFQLLQCRFKLLKRHYTGEGMLNKMADIGLLMTDVAKVVRSPDEIELFKKQYEFLDNILLFMQNLPVTNMTHEFKCDRVALILHSYGYCCTAIKDYFKATALFNQAIASRKLAFGDKSNHYRNFAASYNSLGCALEYSNHLSEAKTAYQTSIEIKILARDYENEEERNRSISQTTNNLQRLENKLKNLETKLSKKKKKKLKNLF